MSAVKQADAKLTWQPGAEQIKAEAEVETA